jgi:hypothetical protein
VGATGKNGASLRGAKGKISQQSSIEPLPVIIGDGKKSPIKVAQGQVCF